MKFEWDPQKEAGSVAKHGVSFAEASTVFADPLAGTIPDPDHSRTEMRFLTIGVSATGRLIVVSHTEEEDDLFRIVSAREATTHERKAYEG